MTRLGLVDVLDRQQMLARARHLEQARQHRLAVARIAAASLPRDPADQAQGHLDKHEAPEIAVSRASTTSTQCGGSSGCSSKSA